jgi:hypothetical protein
MSSDAKGDPRSSARSGVKQGSSGQHSTLGVPPMRPSGGTAMQGDLSAYALTDVLQFLHNLRKDGQLVIERQQPAQSANVSFVEGRLVHAYCPPLQGEECLHYLMNWRSGRFIFLTEAATEKETIKRDFRNVLLDAVRLQDELQRVLGRLPSPTTILHRELEQDRLVDMALTTPIWRLLQRIDGTSSIAEIIEACPRDQLAVAQGLEALVSAGAVRIDADYSFFSSIIVRAIADAEQIAGAVDAFEVQVLAACDGLRTLREIQIGLECSEHDLVDAIILLDQALAIEVAHGHADYERYFPRV